MVGFGDGQGGGGRGAWNAGGARVLRGLVGDVPTLSAGGNGDWVGSADPTWEGRGGAGPGQKTKSRDVRGVTLGDGDQERHGVVRISVSRQVPWQPRLPERVQLKVSVPEQLVRWYCPRPILMSQLWRCRSIFV